MSVLVLGASGVTGNHVVKLLLEKGVGVRAIVRSPEKFKAKLGFNNDLLTIISASILDMKKEELLESLDGCTHVVSCLGHNMTFRGVFGHPRSIVYKVIRMICESIPDLKPSKPTKLILMSSTGVIDPAVGGAGEKRPLFDRIMLQSILVLPPHRDNQYSASYLRKEIGAENAFIEWVVVRPDNLTNQASSDYELFDRPIRSCLTNAGITARANVAQFMCDLVREPLLYDQWKGKMPVIMDSVQPT